jgi:ribosomal protein S18 acetylase RimI-like enzyme
MLRPRTGATLWAVTANGELRTRPETDADAAFLFALFESVKAPELAAMAAGDATKSQLLNMQFRAMTQSYHAAFPNASYDIVLLDNKPIGRLIIDLAPTRVHVVYIALVPQMRNCGIGTSLMTAVLAGPRRRGVVCAAQVAVDNAASLRLWQRLGFVERERTDTDIGLEWRPMERRSST